MFLLFIVIGLIELMCWGVTSALLWQFQWHHSVMGIWLELGIFIAGNGLILLSFIFRNKHNSKFFRWASFYLVIWWFIILVAILIWLLAQFLPWLPIARFQDVMLLTADLRLLAPVLFMILLGWTVFNAYVPRIRYTKIQINKPLKKPVRIGMVADMHLGILMGTRQLDKLAAIFQTERPDIILLPGDIMDDNTAVYEAKNMRPHLEKLRAPLGVYATLGNHDFFGSQDKITQAIEQAGIHVLRDEALFIDGRFWIVGRPDNLDKQRLATSELLKQVNVEQPVFLLDHRPDDINDHIHLPIDVQVSGHVHNGQIFPGNLIVRFLNRLHYGYKEIGLGHYFVTSGYGFWGVPFRLGSRSEVWIIDVMGKE